MTLDDLLLEISYHLPKGYPTIVDGKFVDREEVILINKFLLEHGVGELSVPEAASSNTQPAIGNKTSLQEGMVCLFYDLQANSGLAGRVDALQKEAFQTKQPANTSEVKSVSREITKLFEANKSRYGSKSGGEDAKGSMPSDNLPKYIEWAYTTKDPEGVKKVNNALSAAKTIRQKIGDAVIFRNEDFDAVRTIAVQRAADLDITNLKPDNWCPGDVYLTKNINNVQSAIEAVHLTKSTPGYPALNSFFSRNLQNDTIVACSLKEESAQAGKATEFAGKLFSTTYDSGMSPDEIDASDSPNNKALSDQVSAILRYQAYSPTFPDFVSKGKRGTKSYITAVSKKQKLLSSVNTILKGAGMSPWKGLNWSDNEQEFYKKNKQLFDTLDRAVILLKKKHSSADNQEALRAAFFTTRKSFIEGLKKYDVQVAAKDSKPFYEAILQQKNPTNILSKKIGVYNLALTILERWVNREKANPAYAKLTKITNPFAALTAFAVAESGINPGFWKIIGSDKSEYGEAHWFDPKAKVAIINNKTSPIQLKDSEGEAGFNLEYTTVIGTHKYETQLTFRYSDGQIRIEVQKLKKT